MSDRTGDRAGDPTEAPLLAVRDLVKHYPPRGRRRRSVRSGRSMGRVGSVGSAGSRGSASDGVVHAVCGVSFDLAAGETLGLVGESGSGKSTIARTLLHLTPPTSGIVEMRGRDIGAMRGQELREVRRDLQIVFQDPYASLDPRMTAEQIVAEPLRIFGAGATEARDRVRELLQLVGLDDDMRDRPPASFSGGQRQRIGIARALALEPALLVLDEPVSALDVSIQAGILNLLDDLQRRLGVAYLFIAHDLAVVRHVATRVAVMYLGEIVEFALREQLFAAPAHPYTRALLSATPVPDPVVERKRQRILLQGDPPDPTEPPSGCRFRTRCWRYAGELDEARRERCRTEPPALVDRGQGHPSRCHWAG